MNLFSTNAPATSGIRDNHERGSVGEFLQSRIAPQAELSVVSAFFTIYAYEALQPQLDQIDSMRFLFGEPRFLRGLDPDKIDKKAFDIEDAKLNLANRLQQRATARNCAAWIREKVEVRSIIKPGFLHGKLYHIQNGNTTEAILGSSNFTVAGLGLNERPNLELNLEVDSNRDRADLHLWFDQLWDNPKLVEDVKPQVLEYLARLYADHSPQFIYFKTLFHVFDRFLEETRQVDFDAEQHLYDTQIWNYLFEFQKHGVSGIVSRLNRHGGCILADAVGLGKTSTALAVIKIWESRNKNVLVLCPKKLRDNWTIYQAANNSVLNPFARDRFGYKVLSHTDLGRTSKVGDIDLSTFNWGAFDLVVIDESHNFRNNARGNDERKTRYAHLMDDIIKSGSSTQVLLLSATPVNNDLKDLRNQMYLLTGDNDRKFADSLGIASLRETLAGAQRTFSDWASSRDEIRTQSTLMDKLPGSFWKLMDELSIARSRRHIVRHYSDSLAEIGAFPERAKPISLFPDIDTKHEFLSYDAINDQISAYKLSLFSPFFYVRDEYKHLYDDSSVRNFSQERREHFLVGMMKVNFLKRLESSVHSFAITLRRTTQKIEALEQTIADYEARKTQSDAHRVLVSETLSSENEEGDDETDEAFLIGAKNYDLRHLDLALWKDDLKEDWDKLQRLLDSADKIGAARDAKLEQLKGLLREKFDNPTVNKNGEANRKVLLFTAFADTARYLYEHLHSWAHDNWQIESALVIGGATQTTWGKNEFAHILTNFSPRSKNRDKLSQMAQEREIDLLIGTDCISEGQNLQDCDLVVNYDIHWNPVRLVQRFGRIDRIGSKNLRVQLVNFWPTPDLNRYINLKNRVEARMALVDLSATTEDNLLSGHDEQPLEELISSDLRYRDKQLLRLKDEILDLEDMDEAPSLTEFSLDNFRQELLHHLAENRRELAEAPLGLYAVVAPSDEQEHLAPGVLWCLRRKEKTVGDARDLFDNTSNNQQSSTRSETKSDAARVNPSEPFFLVYVRDDGTVRFGFAQAKAVLDTWRALCLGKTEANEKLCSIFDRETGDGTDMSRYNDLLQKTIENIGAAFQIRNAKQVDKTRGRSGMIAKAEDTVAQHTDFELISWVVIKSNAQ